MFFYELFVTQQFVYPQCCFNFASIQTVFNYGESFCNLQSKSLSKSNYVSRNCRTAINSTEFIQ